MDKKATDTAPALAGPNRPAWKAAGYLALGLGIIGVFLPVMPTAPFILLAAFCFSKGSPRMRAWLLAHPQFGRMINDWEANGAIPRWAKIWAVGAMSVTFAGSWYFGLPFWALVAQGTLMGLGAAYVLTRPNS